MFVPFFSTRSESKRSRRSIDLSGRQLGGGMGGGGLSHQTLIRIGGRALTAASIGRGSTATDTIPAGLDFAGRTMGGATREQIYGTRAYGSGYPGVSGKGTAGRDFPFFFYPLAFGTGTPEYLYETEYGNPDSSSRPGGRLVTITLTSSSDTYRVLADIATVDILAHRINEACTAFLTEVPLSTKANYDGGSSSRPQPEQIIQYYRGSSVALSLDGYSNAAALSADESARDTALPTVDAEFLACLNNTIGTQTPLVTSFVPGSTTSTSTVTPAGGSTTTGSNGAMAGPLSDASGLLGLVSLGLALLSML